MIIISWNARGLNSGPRQKAVRELVRSHSPDVLFLQETKVSVEGMMSIAPKLWKNGQCQCIAAQGSSGGVACLWNPRKIQPLWWISFRSSLSLVSLCHESGESVHFSNVYAPVEFQGKILTWNNIHFVHGLFPYLPWIIAGDFNAILNLSEKWRVLQDLSPLLSFFEIISRLSISWILSLVMASLPGIIEGQEIVALLND